MVSVLICLLVVLEAFAQGSFKIGKYDFVIASSSGVLQAAMLSSQGISHKFATGVGGIAFAGVAYPDISLKDKIVEISYDASQPDGARLIVSVAGNIYKPTIPDWQLIPILKYADSKYNACVSLFGSKANKQFYDIIYHPALNNTLLGLRLLQADILLFDLNEFWKLPTFANKIILGYGEDEKPVSQRELVDTAVSISQVLSTNQNNQAKSWILTDHALDVKFKIEDGNIRFSNFPYYYFWNDNINEYNNDLRIRRDNYNKLVTNLDDLARKYNALLRNRQISIGEAKEAIKILQSQRAEINNKRSEFEKLIKNGPRVYPVANLTNALKSQRTNFEKYNPIVYSAVENTMYFSDFFRYIKIHNSKSWSKIQTQIKNARIEPSIVTPTKWQTPNAIVQQ
jgi:hypothetical protein